MGILKFYFGHKGHEGKSSKTQNQYRHTDVEYVVGVFNNDRNLTEEFYKKCKQYFEDNFKGIFLKEAAENEEDIFQNSFIKLWENIEQGKLYVEGGLLKGHDKKNFRGSLTTYLMSIANYKYLEWVRDNPINKRDDIDSVNSQDIIKQNVEAYDILYGKDDDIMLQIIADCISRMSTRCNQIMTMFYLKNMNLKTIWEKLPTFNSYDALKNEKSRCKKRLQECANGIYEQYLNQ